MTKREQVANLTVVVVPFVGFLASLYLLWNSYVTPMDLLILVCGYALTIVGIGVGFHRLLTHRSFATYRPIRYALAVLGTAAVEGPLISWVADHRKHHSFSDRDGDPHSPHVGRGGGSGFGDALAGLWHAHVGWFLSGNARADRQRYAPDLLADRGMMLISRLFGPIAAISLLVPFAVGYGIRGTVAAGLEALFWGGLTRIFLFHHVTWSINSVCHFFGSRRFETKDESRNVWWLALASGGESWHNNHHAFPTSARHGLGRWEFDLNALAIVALERLGLAWDVVRIPPERLRRREEAAVAGFPSTVAPAGSPPARLTSLDRAGTCQTLEEISERVV